MNVGQGVKSRCPRISKLKAFSDFSRTISPFELHVVCSFIMVSSEIFSGVKVKVCLSILYYYSTALITMFALLASV